MAYVAMRKSWDSRRLLTDMPSLRDWLERKELPRQLLFCVYSNFAISHNIGNKTLRLFKKKVYFCRIKTDLVHLNCMKKLLVIILLVFATQLQAQMRIGEGEAFSTATHFLKHNAKQQSPVLSLNEVIYSKRSGLPNLFVFASGPRGFVIVSATGEVLAYSLHSDFPTTDKLPDHIAYWIDLYNNTTDYIIEHHLPHIQRKVSRQEVEPLLTSAWGQGCFHNELCPASESGPCHHASAGCVAIAMAQIMYYHKQPETGNGEVSYTCQYGNLSANFGETVYPWEEMVDTLHESNLATALLISHCGISVTMDYNPHSSGSSINKALKAFQNHFLYPTSKLLQRSDSKDEEWISIIKNNLDMHLPVYYRGISSLGGHAFVCDGYDSNGLFHFNFGWDGVADGYYTLENPSGFDSYQAIIYDISPISNATVNSDSHGIIYVSPDGSGDGSSWAQATSNLQSALCKSHSDSLTIWVKEGYYTRTSIGDYCFYPYGNCQIYGGFNGDEPYDYDLSLRNFDAHPSILDGNHTKGLINAQYCNSFLIDGFTIQNGSAPSGGGLSIKSNTHIKNCKICNNQAQLKGGGIALLSSENAMEIVIEDCEFFGNEAKNGGAIYDASNATYLRCRIHDNTASKSGGGIHRQICNRPSEFICCQISNNTASAGGGVLSSSQASFWSCLINNNTAETGGGCYIKDKTNLYNCTIVKNEGLVEYGGVYNPESTSPNVRNCIIWGNVSQDGNKQIGPMETHEFCAVQDDTSFSSFNFDAEPENDGTSPGFYIRFNNADVAAGIEGRDGDWHLQSGSLCIDRTDTIANQPETDLDGNPRLRHSNVDLGAFESNSVAYLINRLFCNNDPYYYHGVLLPNPGFYSFLYPNIPYDSLVIINLERRTIAEEAEICEGETYNFHGEMLDEAGHYSTTINCIAYELDLVVNPLPIVNQEVEIYKGETYNFFGETLHETGHYTAIYDCTDYELDLTVIPVPVVTMNEAICQGETYNFFGQKLNKTGHYSTYMSGKDYELDLSVLPLPALRCSNDTLIEYGNAVQLTASGADSYLWSTGETTKSITVRPTEDITYFVKGFSQNGCDKTATVTVTVHKENDQVSLFPNPASDKAIIDIPFMEEVDVFNLYGDHIINIIANREAVELDVSSFPDGIYIIQVRQMKNLYHKKLVVQH